MELVLLGISILPVILFGFYIYIKDKNKEPTGLLVKLFMSGLLSIITTLLLTRVLVTAIPFFGYDTKRLDLVSLFIYIFIGIALIEEFSKFIYAYLIGYKSNEFDESYDAIIYCAFVSLGFACFENILYIFVNASMNEALTTGVMRAVTAVPGHLCDAIVMGYFLSLAKQKKNDERKYIVLSILVPTLLHCIYDFLLYTGLEVMVMVFFAFIISLFIICYNIIKKQSNENRRINGAFCTKCGSKIQGNFCSKCGNKVC